MNRVLWTFFELKEWFGPCVNQLVSLEQNSTNQNQINSSETYASDTPEQKSFSMSTGLFFKKNGNIGNLVERCFFHLSLLFK